MIQCCKYWPGDILLKSRKVSRHFFLFPSIPLFKLIIIFVFYGFGNRKNEFGGIAKSFWLQAELTQV